MGAGWQFCWGSNRLGGGGGGRLGAGSSSLQTTDYITQGLVYVMCNTLQATANKNKNL